MTVDQLHIGLTALTWLAGLFVMAKTYRKVGKMRRMTYILAVPLWVFFLSIYAYAFANYQPQDEYGWVDLALRVALGGVALEGILVPYIDGLESEGSPVTEIRIVGPGH